MGIKRRGEQLITAVLVCAVLALLLGQALGQPVLLGYVTTGSMAPTLDPGDGYIAVPAALTGPPEPGDVVVFRAETIQDGGLTTHRVVGRTEEGYITRGDANEFTDQATGEPPVREEQIVVEVLQLGGHIVVVPQLGTAVEGVRETLTGIQRTVSSTLGVGAFLGPQGLALLIFVASILLYAVDVIRVRGNKQRERSRSRTDGVDTRLVVAVLASMLVLSVTASMVLPTETHQFDVLSTDSVDSDRSDVILAGQSKTNTLGVVNGGPIPVVTFFEPGSRWVEVDPRVVSVDGRSRVNVAVTLHAPREYGAYRRFLVEYRYLAVLPTSVLRSLYHVHPWAPIVVIDALIGVPFYLVGVTLAGSGRIRNRSRDRGVPLAARIRRAMKRLYS